MRKYASLSYSFKYTRRAFISAECIHYNTSIFFFLLLLLLFLFLSSFADDGVVGDMRAVLLLLYFFFKVFVRVRITNFLQQPHVMGVKF